MTILATTNNSHAGNFSQLSHASVVAAGSRMVGPDILRSLAILLVMLVHLPLNATPGILVTVREYGWLGVDIFFVLSGYLIGMQLFKEVTRTGAVDFKSFYLRRAFRIFPAFFVVLGLYALVPVLRDNPAMQPLWKFATFTVNLGFDPRAGNAFSQAWTLAVEEQFYLVLPLLVLFLYKRIGTGWVLGLAGLLMLAGVVLRYAIWDIQVGSLVAEGQFRPAFATYLRDVYYPTYTRLDGLLFGVVLAAARFFKPQLCRQYLSPKVTIPSGLIFVIAALICFVDRGPLAGQGIFPVFQAQLGAVAGFPLISIGIALLFCAMLDLEHVLSRWPVPGAALVATLSYSLYLTHKSVFHVMRQLVGEENLQGSFGFVVYLIASFVVAVVLWFCVERTFLRLRDRLLSPSK
ncbi:acyltransferase family protein [Agrobacterium fabrum]|uniref:Acyltransferase n=1 Tax=Agrobacterium fabrum TaxID=1176649 RepID=A0A2Z2PGN5_9HYPH|nr:acyltransferase [Agrobacterium fabrum]ASK42003.1 acyltransferase [Agrobacterium fabrum]WCK80381.1 acyltransferase [Agrobacterium fabrum]